MATASLSEYVTAGVVKHIFLSPLFKNNSVKTMPYVHLSIVLENSMLPDKAKNTVKGGPS